MELQNPSSADMIQYFKRQNRRHMRQQQTHTNANSSVSERNSDTGLYRNRNSSIEADSSQGQGHLSSYSKQTFCDDLNIITGAVRHSRFATIDARTKTFIKWPKKNVCEKKMVDAGFVYTLKDDIVECFHCGGVLRDWPEFSDPWQQHALAFPKCPHVRRCKGDQYINSVRAKLINSNAKIVNNSGYSVVDVIMRAPRSDGRVTGAIQASLNDENSLALNDSVKKLSLDSFTVDSLSRALTEINNETSNDSDVTDGCENDSALELENMDTIEEDNRRLKEPITCKICFDAIACVVTLPCGHMVSCVQCIPALTSCAVCRTPIKGTVRAVMAVNYSNEHVGRS